MTYRLVRITPDGKQRTQKGLASRRLTGAAAFHVLNDNRALDRREAARAGQLVEDAPIGTLVAAGGYLFMVEEESHAGAMV